MFIFSTYQTDVSLGTLVPFSKSVPILGIITKRLGGTISFLFPFQRTKQAIEDTSNFRRVYGNPRAIPARTGDMHGLSNVEIVARGQVKPKLHLRISFPQYMSPCTKYHGSFWDIKSSIRRRYLMQIITMFSSLWNPR